MPQTVGYKLIETSDNGREIMQWGGVWGQTPGIPNPLILPSSLNHVHCAELGVSYTDFDGKTYTLTPWMMDAPAKTPSNTPISMRQLRLGLIQFGGKGAGFIQSIIDSMQSPAKDFAQVWYDETQIVNWDHPQTQAFIAESGIPLDQCAQMWMAAAATFEA